MWVNPWSRNLYWSKTGFESGKAAKVKSGIENN